MLLVIDVGNTNIVFGLFDGAELRHQFRVESVRGRTADEYSVVLHSLLRLHGVDVSRVTAAIVGSVVPQLNEPMVNLVKRTFGHTPLEVEPGIKSGIRILTDNPKELGADRIVNAVAAYDRFKDAVIVVDFGTATTFDCVTARGEYTGGIIAPGMQIAADALFARAAKLPRVEIAKPPKVLGKNTLTSMQSGIVFGYVGLVDGLIDRLFEELGYECPVIATGGLATLIAPLSRTIGECDDQLTLTGLRLLYERNV